jgi:hypothetical protein
MLSSEHNQAYDPRAIMPGEPAADARCCQAAATAKAVKDKPSAPNRAQAETRRKAEKQRKDFAAASSLQRQQSLLSALSGSSPLADASHSDTDAEGGKTPRPIDKSPAQRRTQPAQSSGRSSAAAQDDMRVQSPEVVQVVKPKKQRGAAKVLAAPTVLHEPLYSHPEYYDLAFSYRNYAEEVC